MNEWWINNNQVPISKGYYIFEREKLCVSQKPITFVTYDIGKFSILNSWSISIMGTNGYYVIQSVFS